MHTPMINFKFSYYKATNNGYRSLETNLGLDKLSAKSNDAYSQ